MSACRGGAPQARRPPSRSKSRRAERRRVSSCRRGNCLRHGRGGETPTRKWRTRSSRNSSRTSAVGGRARPAADETRCERDPRRDDGARQAPLAGRERERRRARDRSLGMQEKKDWNEGAGMRARRSRFACAVARRHRSGGADATICASMVNLLVEKQEPRARQSRVAAVLAVYAAAGRSRES